MTKLKERPLFVDEDISPLLVDILKRSNFKAERVKLGEVDAINAKNLKNDGILLTSNIRDIQGRRGKGALGRQNATIIVISQKLASNFTLLTQYLINLSTRMEFNTTLLTTGKKILLKDDGSIEEYMSKYQKYYPSGIPKW